MFSVPGANSGDVTRGLRARQCACHGAAIQRVDGSIETVNAKAVRWTATLVCIHWAAKGQNFYFWVPADHFTRITRRESAWEDVYDDFEGYYAEEY